ncbi:MULTISPECIES: ribose 5-phosphate isomerase A [Bacillus]|jgi:ribose 5-phosphate isomerase A|uniref:Ribose-5-phosphate isomerase A n=5 Tax=Bacillus cereus group TaxID=86661 RepID=RPIA_BACC1|nr:MULTISPECIES: ribose 5-phosphate isomerase A [Bacillus]Q736S8.1 RecName: Full=Ribose-5-phosphate isomerase A; AltName: Full=Phosphoriboisomerase A; Short=PRI [Bacillus cereus ATCC 10987]ACM13062.1 ribose 5-phosphate isomerase [Bacillus cereus Q1]ASI78188.1 ribose 5-phosphate isomerase A [Bacillus cereus]AAS41734.1 ribose 5-phosphate isomerase [Bacillus cereus ATCC 10987]KMQ36384.1 ribose 5-phosphate isomerase [Bacillus cereus]KXI54998.1 ribose-5-phosphate isomerase [Bacillus cereus]
MNLKQLAGEYAATFVKDGMKIGLGTGSTVYWTIEKLGERVKEGLSFQAVPTSKETEVLAQQLNIPLISLNDIQSLDLTIDGADEIDSNLHLIKGGGGALLREKIVASSSKELLIIADESKLVTHLGTFPLPVEIIPFSWKQTESKIQSLGCQTTLRLKNNETFITDNNNMIIDCVFPHNITNPANLHNHLKMITGVVETGLFVNMTSKAIIGTKNGIQEL